MEFADPKEESRSSDLIFTCLPRPNSRIQTVMILDPMYGEYHHVIETVLGAQTVSFMLQKEDDFRIDTDRLIASAQKHRPDLLVLVNNSRLRRRHGQRHHVGAYPAFAMSRLRHGGEAEVQHLDRAIRRKHDVRRFQVAMRDPLLMGRVECARNLRGMLQRGIDGHGTLQRFAFDQFHNQGLALGGFFHRVYARNVGMVQRSQNFRFPLKARQTIRMLRKRSGQDLDRYVTIQLGVSGAIHFAHATRTKRREDLIWAEFVARGQTHMKDIVESIRSVGGLRLHDAVSGSYFSFRSEGPVL